jgi:hypothetical protein
VSYSTLAAFCSSETFTLRTPASRVMVPVTLFTQPPQCMPSTANFCVTVAVIALSP